MSILDSNKIITECLSGRIDRVIDRTLADKRLVGAVIKVAIDGELVYSRAAGFADRQLSRLMREDALFRLASVTKPIVSTAALVLVAQGRLQLDDRVDRWLPEFQPRLQNGEFASLTIRHLMTHTAACLTDFSKKRRVPISQQGYQMVWISPASHWKRTCAVLPLSPSFIRQVPSGNIPSRQMCWEQ